MSRERESGQVQYVGNYDLIRTVGQGQFGKVKLARHVLTGEMVAVKIIHKSQLDEKSLRMISREVNVMKRLEHPNIIRLYEVLETEKMLFLVMEYAKGGEVLEYIVAHGRLREPEARRFFQQVIDAMMHCHANFVVHRDLKAENLLLDGDRNVKIIDFGLSNFFTPGKLLSTFCGSPTYAAPELLRKQPYKGPEVDVWSSGVLLYALTCGALPFDGEDFKTLFSKILTANFIIPPYLSEDLVDLMCRMLTVDSKKRITMAEVRQHPWVTNNEPIALTISEPLAHNKDITRDRLDNGVLDHLEALGFDRENSVRSIVEQKYDVAASTYSLLLKKKDKDRKRREEVAERKKELERRRIEERQKKGHKRGQSCSVAESAVAGAVASVDPKKLVFRGIGTTQVGGNTAKSSGNMGGNGNSIRTSGGAVVSSSNSSSSSSSCSSTDHSREEIAEDEDKKFSSKPPVIKVDSFTSQTPSPNPSPTGPPAQSPVNFTKAKEKKESSSKGHRRTRTCTGVVLNTEASQQPSSPHVPSSPNYKVPKPRRRNMSKEPFSPTLDDSRVGESEDSPIVTTHYSRDKPTHAQQKLEKKMQKLTITQKKEEEDDKLSVKKISVAGVGGGSASGSSVGSGSGSGSGGAHRRTRSTAAQGEEKFSFAGKISRLLNPNPSSALAQEIKEEERNSSAAAVSKEEGRGGGSGKKTHRRTRSVVPDFSKMKKAEPKEEKDERERGSGASGDDERRVQPREIRGAISPSNTSIKPPQEIMMEIFRVLGELKATGVTPSSSPFVVECVIDSVSLYLEVCQVAGISKTYFVRMKRLHGESMAFKKTCDKITEILQLN